MMDDSEDLLRYNEKNVLQVETFASYLRNYVGMYPFGVSFWA